MKLPYNYINIKSYYAFRKYLQNFRLNSNCTLKSVYDMSVGGGGRDGIVNLHVLTHVSFNGFFSQNFYTVFRPL